MLSTYYACDGGKFATIAQVKRYIANTTESRPFTVTLYKAIGISDSGEIVYRQTVSLWQRIGASVRRVGKA